LLQKHQEKSYGYEWRDITETEGTDMTQMVFIKDNKPVCYLYGNINDIGLDVNINKSEYKDNVATIISGDNDKLSIEKEKVSRVINGYNYEDIVIYLKQIE